MNIYYLALIITFVFLFFKIIQYKFNKEEEKSIKPAFIDSIIVFISVIIGDFTFQLTNPIMKEAAPQVFTNNPTF